MSIVYQLRAFIAVVSIGFFLCSLEAESTTDFKITDQGLHVNDRPFTVQGVNYSPIPIGAS